MKNTKIKIISFIIIAIMAFALSPIMDGGKPSENQTEVVKENSSQDVGKNASEEAVDKDKASDKEADSDKKERTRPKDIAGLVEAGVLTEKLSESGEVIGWESNEGLFYGMGSKHGNRVLHVLEHLKPNPKKKKHSVFETDEQGLIELIDEAWSNRESGYTELQSNGNRIYDIDMGRKIGTEGQTEIRIVVKDGSESIITAYPRR